MVYASGGRSNIATANTVSIPTANTVNNNSAGIGNPSESTIPISQ